MVLHILSARVDDDPASVSAFVPYQRMLVSAVAEVILAPRPGAAQQLPFQNHADANIADVKRRYLGVLQAAAELLTADDFSRVIQRVEERLTWGGDNSNDRAGGVCSGEADEREGVAVELGAWVVAQRRQMAGLRSEAARDTWQGGVGG